MDTYNKAKEDNVELNHVPFLLGLVGCSPEFPCQNGGTCDSIAHFAVCICPSGFEGNSCQGKQQVFNPTCELDRWKPAFVSV